MLLQNSIILAESQMTYSRGESFLLHLSLEKYTIKLMRDLFSKIGAKTALLPKVRKQTWALWGFFAFVAISLIMLMTAVDLSPQVEEDFFFSSDNPSFQSSKMIEKLFPSNSSQIVVSAVGDIYSPDYIKRVEAFSNLISVFPGVISVKSMTSGPSNPKDATESPLWRRLLISADGESSNIVAFLQDASPEDIIPRIEMAIELIKAPGFDLSVAGVPYVVEMIRRNLARDLAVFSLIALLVFGVVMVMVFRSVRIYLGTMIACIEACIFTLLLLGLAGIKIGILTVNLATIVFVLTLSHIIFITHNWKNLREEGKNAHRNIAFGAAKMTFSASFWCMITTLMGFLSLLFVQAKPLRELGIGGAIGTIAAITAAYCIYPFFLWFVKPPKRKVKSDSVDKSKKFFIKRSKAVAAVIILASLACIPGIRKLNTDPSLFAFFSKGSDLRRGLEYIDDNGGSSPLDLVVKDAEGDKLNTNKTYKRMWALQEALEEDPNVGSIVSLPVLMSEGSRAPLAFLLTWESLLKWMEKPEYGRISRSFITDDHTTGRFLIRMKETARKGSRKEAVENLKMIVVEHGFTPEMVGGLYILQGELAKLVSASLIFGLGRLILAFIGIAFIVSRSFKISFSMVLSLCVVPLCVFGVAGYGRVPIDIISAPAVNVAIGMGIDSMIHLVSAVRRRRKNGMDYSSAWIQSRARLWQPILSSMFIICAGFAIFTLSAFPPTQRFGSEIVFGTILASLSALFVLPVLATMSFRKK